MNTKLGHAIILLTVALIVSPSVFAQTTGAQVVGRVTDPSDAVIPGAKVTVHNVDTGVEKDAQSNQEGYYAVPFLDPGRYRIIAQAEGFKPVSRTGVVLEMRQVARVDFTLEVGAVTEVIEVSAAPPILNTETATKGDVITATEIEELPLVSRDFLVLATLVPGVTAGDSDFLGHMNINGARGHDVNYLLEGGVNRSMRVNGTQVQATMESIQEFKLETFNYSAEYGRFSSGVMNTKLKSGGNRIHGLLYNFARNDVFDARNFFDQKVSKNNRHNFGGTIGGPIIKNKLFYFGSYDGLRAREGEPRLARVMTARQRLGDFGENKKAVKDPLNKNKPFPGNQIPLDRLNPAARNILEYLPDPNLDAPFGKHNYFNNQVNQNRHDRTMGKVDWNLANGDSLGVHIVNQRTDNLVPFRATPIEGFEQVSNPNNWKLGGTYTHLFGPTLINQTIASYSKGGNRWAPWKKGDTYWGDVLGIPGLPNDPDFYAFPWISMSGYQAFGDRRQVRTIVNGRNTQINNLTTYITGAHNVRWGGEYVYSPLGETIATSANGRFDFRGRWTGDSAADYFLGLLDSSRRRADPIASDAISSSISFYVQDDWKVKPNLTLNLGVRWDIFESPHESEDRWSNYIPELDRVITPGEAGYPRALVFTNYRNFGPRVGLAWRPFGENTVIRVGYGLFNSSNPIGPFQGMMGANFPFTSEERFNRNKKKADHLTLTTPFPGSGSISGISTLNAVQGRFDSPNVHQWNFTIERRLSDTTALEASYVGSKGTHLGRKWNLNQPIRSAETAPDFPRPLPDRGTINYQGFDADSNYNALQVSLRRRGRGGFTYRANYTFSKSIDAGSSVSSNAGMQNAYDRDAERGRSDFDRRHLVSGALVYELPFFRSSHGWKKAVLAGWQLNSVVRVWSGLPFTPSVKANADLGEANRPDRIGNGNLANPTVEKWFALEDFVEVPTGSFRFGNSGRNVVDGPQRWNVDASVAKNFRFTDRTRLQFRWEVSNLPNYANFRAPNREITASTAGVVSRSLDARQMQFVLRLMF